MSKADRHARERAFILEGGKAVHTIRELHHELGALPDPVIQGHLERKDFSAWVKEVFGEGRLARKLAGCRTKDSFQKALGDWVGKQTRQPKKEKAEKRSRMDFSDWFRSKENEFLMDVLCFILGGIVGALITLMVIGYV